MNEQINNILQDLSNNMKPSRYNHTLGVAYTAAALCMNYGIEAEQGMLAGVLHDCAKIQSITDNVATCREYGIPVTSQDEAAPHLLHAELGAYLAQHKYGVDDKDILHAIRVHTQGCENMSLLDKIIYIADYIEPNREKQIPNLIQLRKLAFEDIDRCLLLVLKQTLDYLKSKNFYIDNRTIITYNYYNKLLTSQEVHHE